MWTGKNLGVLILKIKCYMEVLTRLSVQRKRPKLWPDKWVLRHDSGPVRDELKVS
jgi:hypothetical protein